MQKRPLAMVCLLMIVAIFFGTRFINNSPPAFLDWEGKKVIVIGEVYQKEAYQKAEKEVAVVYIKTDCVLCGDNRADTRPGDYRAICYLSSNQELPKLGSIVRVTGRMDDFEEATNPGQFNAKSYYQISKISFQLNQTIIQQESNTYHRAQEAMYRFRCRVSEVFEQRLPEKDASVMKTMLLGEKKAVDGQRKELYQKNGIAHILAISGLHISLIGMALFRILQKIGVPVWICTFLSAILIYLYGGMAGFSVSVIRAIGMFTIQMLGRTLRRTYDMLTAAMVMALLVLLSQPLFAYSVSFWLSFGCVLIIALMIPALTVKRLKYEKELPKGISGILGGIIISAAMLFLQMWFFYQIPLYASILNLLIIPLMSFLLPAGIVLWLFYEISALFALGSVSILEKIPSYLISGILAIYDSACTICNKLPGAIYITGKPAPWKMLCFLSFLAIIVIYQRRFSLKKKWLVLCVAIVILLLPGRSECRITFLDVGQGDCIHIESESGKHYLIDGGSSDVSAVGEYRILPYLKYRGVRKLEAVFVTHPDLDHCNGIMELLETSKEEGIVINRLCLPDVTGKSEIYEKMVELAAEEGVHVTYFSKGMYLQEGALRLECLHPDKGYETENENAYSLVFLMQYGSFQALFTGDVEKDGEVMLVQTLRELMKRESEISRERGYLEPDVLKVAHHGSAYSTTDEFLSLIRPKLAVISCGEDNAYGHPHKETLDRLKEAGTKVLSTSKQGAITVKVGQKIQVLAYKPDM